MTASLQMILHRGVRCISSREGSIQTQVTRVEARCAGNLRWRLVTKLLGLGQKGSIFGLRQRFQRGTCVTQSFNQFIKLHADICGRIR
jgi:hypothetical protein